jgi:hypothetical protein
VILKAPLDFGQTNGQSKSDVVLFKLQLAYMKYNKSIYDTIYN